MFGRLYCLFYLKKMRFTRIKPLVYTSPNQTRLTTMKKVLTRPRGKAYKVHYAVQCTYEANTSALCHELPLF